MGDLRSTYRHLVAGAGRGRLPGRHHGSARSRRQRRDLRQLRRPSPPRADIVALDRASGRPGDGDRELDGGCGRGHRGGRSSPTLVSGLVLVGPFVRNPPGPAWQRLMFRALMGGPWATAGLAGLLPRPSTPPVGTPTTPSTGQLIGAASGPYRAIGRAFRATTRASHAPAEAVLDQVHTDGAGRDGHQGSGLPGSAGRSGLDRGPPRRTHRDDPRAPVTTRSPSSRS